MQSGERRISMGVLNAVSGALAMADGRRWVAPAMLIAVGATACAGASTSPSHSTGPSLSATTAADSAPASASPSASEPVGERYASTSFAVPLTVIVEPLLKLPPIADTTNLLTWDAAADDNEKIRFLIPVKVYPPLSYGRSGDPEPPPTDYLAYLLGQASYGAEFSDRSTITVDGHAATVMTATTPRSLNASLGCPELGMDQDDEACFGLQPQYILRIAVIDMGDGTTLLAWARTGFFAPDKKFNAMFGRMLANLQFN
jgi:hypothetical protein